MALIYNYHSVLHKVEIMVPPFHTDFIFSVEDVIGSVCYCSVYLYFRCRNCTAGGSQAGMISCVV